MAKKKLFSKPKEVKIEAETNFMDMSNEEGYVPPEKEGEMHKHRGRNFRGDIAGYRSEREQDDLMKGARWRWQLSKGEGSDLRDTRLRVEKGKKLTPKGSDPKDIRLPVEKKSSISPSNKELNKMVDGSNDKPKTYKKNIFLKRKPSR